MGGSWGRATWAGESVPALVVKEIGNLDHTEKLFSSELKLQQLNAGGEGDTLRVWRECAQELVGDVWRMCTRVLA